MEPVNLIGLILLGIVIAAMLLNQDRIAPAQPKSGPPQKVPHTCPHCGSEASRWYTPGREKPPVLFTCYECYRKCGDISRMTDAEKQELRASDAACRKAEQLPGLDRIKRLVYDCTAEKKNFLVFRDGQIRVYKKGGMETVGYYEPAGLGKIGTQHLCVLCIGHCRKIYRQRGIDGYIAFELMDGGIAWEWKFDH